jgi:hypothetical protein
MGFTYRLNNQTFWSSVSEATSKTNPSVRMTGYYNYRVVAALADSTL